MEYCSETTLQQFIFPHFYRNLRLFSDPRIRIVCFFFYFFFNLPEQKFLLNAYIVSGVKRIIIPAHVIFVSAVVANASAIPLISWNMSAKISLKKKSKESVPSPLSSGLTLRLHMTRGNNYFRTGRINKRTLRNNGLIMGTMGGSVGANTSNGQAENRW